MTTSTTHLPIRARTAVALALATLCGAALAAPLPQFTFDPNAVGLGSPGNAFTADNLLISDYSTITFGADNTFTDTGYLAISGVQLGATQVDPLGLNSTYGLYVQFTGTGTLTTGGGMDPGKAAASGSFSTLTYTLYGYNGAPAAFNVSGANVWSETASNEIALASGSLINGMVTSQPTGKDNKFVPSAFADLSFMVAAGSEKFFKSPSPFYDLALTSFTNTTSQVTAFEGGFRIAQGGGSINFDMTPAVPEPQTYALMLAGLAAMGFVVRRRRYQG